MRASPLASDNPRAFFEKAATALDGEHGTGAGVASWLCSRFDPFLNQLFVDSDAWPEEAASRLAERPGFVWMASEPAPDAQRRMRREGFTLTAFYAMRADGVTETRDGAPAPVRGRDELAAWHAVYSEVLGADPRSADDWQRLYRALGPDGDGSLWLWLLRADGEPAAAAALFVDDDVAGLYCFATRERFRRRGLASELAWVCRDRARRQGADRCVLQASAAGRAVYARAGFVDIGLVPIFVRR